MKIAVLVSGGVDSSVALALLKSQGHDVTAFYLKIWLEDEISYLTDCPWEEDLAYVRQVCAQLDVPLEVVSLQQEYRDEVVGYTLREVKAGRTPNPDILCNKRIKFGLFLDKIDSKFEKVATGHYARVMENNPSIHPSLENDGHSGRTEDGHYACLMQASDDSFVSFARSGRTNYELHMAPDPIKDQTYFLSHLSQAQLSRALFPIGHLSKAEVRDLARQLNLPNKDRKDSQGICFLGKFKYRDFIKHYLGEKPGDLIEHETGTKLGTHDGFWFYTVGQRQGIGLAGGPWYVVAKDCDKNIVFISREYYAQDKVRNSFEVDNVNWLSDVVVPQSLRWTQGGLASTSEHQGIDALLSLSKHRDERFKGFEGIRVKMRHGPHLKDCTVTDLGNGVLRVTLAQDDQGIAAGQYAVFYVGNQCIASGIIR